MSGLSQGKLLNALDLYLNILQAEKVAIEARDLDTVENLLKTKDESLSLVLSSKSENEDNFTKEVQDRINSVVSLQSSNTQNFRKLHTQDHNQTGVTESSNPLFRRLKRAYS
jgi:hypothetical protein